MHFLSIKSRIMINRIIWKYSLGSAHVQTIDMPRGATILSIQMQHGAPQVWVYCDPTEPREPRAFRIEGTGHKITEHPGKFICTFLDGDFVWHVFETSAHTQNPKDEP